MQLNCNWLCKARMSFELVYFTKVHFKPSKSLLPIVLIIDYTNLLLNGDIEVTNLRIQDRKGSLCDKIALVIAKISIFVMIKIILLAMVWRFL